MQTNFHFLQKEFSDIYKEIARKAAIKIANASLDYSGKFPNIVIQNT